MFAHVSGTGKGYYAHGGNWIRLANYDELTSLTGLRPGFKSISPP